MTNYIFIKKILGNINPVGESHVDTDRFENLKETTELVGMLLSDIRDVAHTNKTAYEHSRKKASEFASNFLKEMGISEYEG
ncbi:MAG: hypothetical protein WC026_13125 [Hyphomicrobium sp.]|uniref:hypothetical protein n=1 Tax=Hyphomicrobium sp. TaxID=82 RepID=UPI0035676C3A